MKIDINSIKTKLMSNGSSLVDPRILEEDMKSVYDYYKVMTADERGPNVSKYFSRNDQVDFKLIEFTSAYLTDSLGFKVNVDRTEDNYIILH